MSRCIVATVKNLTEDKIKSQANENHQSFKVATVDNVDQNVKSGELVFGKKVENIHTTTIQSVEPGPASFINTASDYCSFVRQINELSDITFPSLKQVNVFEAGVFFTVSPPVFTCHCCCVIEMKEECHEIPDLKNWKQIWQISYGQTL